MRPELFRVFEVAFPAYFLMLLSGFVFATASGAVWARRIGRNPDVIVDLGLACLLMGVVGGRLLHVLADGYFWDYVHLCTDPSQVDWKVDQALCVPRFHGVWDAAKGVCHPIERDCLAWAKFWAGGLTYYGGLVAASLMAIYLLRRDRFPFWKAADMAGFAVPLGLGFGRMGCLLAGCCFGIESTSGVALSFPPGSPASESQFKLHELGSTAEWSHPVHPTQIYESAASLGIAAFCLLYVHGRKRYDGQVFVTFLGLYAIARFLLEYVRADDRGGAAGLSTSQLIGVAIVAVSIALHLRLSKRARTGGAPPPAGSSATPALATLALLVIAAVGLAGCGEELPAPYKPPPACGGPNCTAAGPSGGGAVTSGAGGSGGGSGTGGGSTTVNGTLLVLNTSTFDKGAFYWGKAKIFAEGVAAAADYDGTTFTLDDVPSGVTWFFAEDATLGASGVYSTYSAVDVPASNVKLPVIEQALLTSIGSSLPSPIIVDTSGGAAQIILEIDRNGKPLSGVSVTASGGADVAYDEGQGVYTNQSAGTQTAGRILLFNVTAPASGGHMMLDLDDGLGNGSTVDVPIRGGAATIAGFDI